MFVNSTCQGSIYRGPKLRDFYTETKTTLIQLSTTPIFLNGKLVITSSIQCFFRLKWLPEEEFLVAKLRVMKASWSSLACLWLRLAAKCVWWLRFPSGNEVIQRFLLFCLRIKAKPLFCLCVRAKSLFCRRVRAKPLFCRRVRAKPLSYLRFFFSSSKTKRLLESNINEEINSFDT